VLHGTRFADSEPCDDWWYDDEGERLINGRDDKDGYVEPGCVKKYRDAGGLSLECWSGLPVVEPIIANKRRRFHASMLPTPGGGTTDESFLGVMKVNILDSFDDDIDAGKPLLGWFDGGTGRTAAVNRVALAELGLLIRTILPNASEAAQLHDALFGKSTARFEKELRQIQLEIQRSAAKNRTLNMKDHFSRLMRAAHEDSFEERDFKKAASKVGADPYCAAAVKAHPKVRHHKPGSKDMLDEQALLDDHRNKLVAAKADGYNIAPLMRKRSLNKLMIQPPKPSEDDSRTVDEFLYDKLNNITQVHASAFPSSAVGGRFIKCQVIAVFGVFDSLAWQCELQHRLL
jgi:hypothetical protein